MYLVIDQGKISFIRHWKLFKLAQQRIHIHSTFYRLRQGKYEQVDAYFQRFESAQTTTELTGGSFIDHEVLMRVDSSSLGIMKSPSE